MSSTQLSIPQVHPSVTDSFDYPHKEIIIDTIQVRQEWCQTLGIPIDPTLAAMNPHQLHNKKKIQKT